MDHNNKNMRDIGFYILHIYLIWDAKTMKK